VRESLFSISRNFALIVGLGESGSQGVGERAGMIDESTSQKVPTRSRARKAA
jgi:hypothetical protein